MDWVTPSFLAICRFPKDPALRSSWEAAVNRPEWHASRRSRLCSLHFPSSSILRVGKSVRLVEGMVNCKGKFKFFFFCSFYSILCQARQSISYDLLWKASKQYQKLKEVSNNYSQETTLYVRHASLKWDFFAKYAASLSAKYVEFCVKCTTLSSAYMRK